MKKTLISLIMILITSLTIPFMVGCDNNRPNFPVPNSGVNSNSSVSNETINLTLGNNIIISSTSQMNKDANIISLGKGSLIKIKLDLQKFTSTANETFYFDDTTNSIITSIKFNDEILSLSNLNEHFAVWNDATISVVSSKLTLCSMMICEDYNTDESDKLYKKFNYKSNNFRNSLISFEDESLSITNSAIKYICFDENNFNSNVSNISNYDNQTKILKTKINAYYETTEISFVFVYKDENNNLFLSEVQKISQFSQTQNEDFTTNFKVYDDSITSFDVEFIKYYLPEAV